MILGTHNTSRRSSTIEMCSAYFLEANFAGVGNTSDIKMEWVVVEP
jgi:hypothetical protein